MTNQRMKWDAEAAFKRIDEDRYRHMAHQYHPEWGPACADRPAYTPPPNVAAWLKAQADKPKPRDYDAILRAAKKPPVGYWEDAPTGIKFKPSKPQYLIGFDAAGDRTCFVYAQDDKGMTWYRDGEVKSAARSYTSNQERVGKDMRLASVEEAIEVVRKFGRVECFAEISAWLTKYRHPFDAAKWAPTPPPQQPANGGQPLPSASTKPHGKDVDTADGPSWIGESFDGRVEALHHCGVASYYRDGGSYSPCFRQSEVAEYDGKGPFKIVPQSVALERLEAHGHADVAARLRGKDDDVATVRVTISTAPRAEVDCKTRCELKQTHVKIEMATGLIIPCDETDPDKIGYVR